MFAGRGLFGLNFMQMDAFCIFSKSEENVSHTTVWGALENGNPLGFFAAFPLHFFFFIISVGVQSSIAVRHQYLMLN